MCDIWNRCRFAVNEIKTLVSKFTVKQNLFSFNFTSGRFNYYYDLFLYLFMVFIFFFYVNNFPDRYHRTKCVD